MKGSCLCFALLLLLLPFCVGSARSTTWIEVARFADLGDISEPFNCSHIQWRIEWNYTPSATDPSQAGFGFEVYRASDNATVTAVYQSGNGTTNGVKDVLSLPGSFYVRIGITEVDHYTVVIEQDVDSVPEFPSIIAPLVFTAITTGLIVLAAKRGYFCDRSRSV